MTIYKIRHSEFLPYFTQENDIVYCNDVARLLQQLGVQQHKPQDWRLFIDSSKRSLICVLLHNGNSCRSFPFGHSTTLKEKCDEIKFVLEKISYRNSTNGLYCMSRFENSGVSPRIAKWLHKIASCVCGTARQEKSTGQEKIGLCAVC